MNGVEKQIARKVAEAMIAAGYELILCDGEEETSFVDYDSMIAWCDNLDECWFLTSSKADGFSKTFVYFIWGNGNGGRDCISDYGMSLEPLLAPILEWTDKAEARLLEE